MMTFHHQLLQDDMASSKREDYLSLEPCEVLIEEKCVQGELTPWIHEVEISNVSLVHVDGTQNEKTILELLKLEEPR